MTTPTPEAIEAIAVAIFYQQVGLTPPYPLWDDADAVEKDNCRNDAQLAYDAMAPFIAAQAKAEALREAAAVWGAGLGLEAFAENGVEDDVSAVQATVKWLDERSNEVTP